MAVLAGFCAGKCIEHLLSGRDAQFLIQGSLLYTFPGEIPNGGLLHRRVLSEKLTVRFLWMGLAIDSVSLLSLHRAPASLV